MGATPAFGEPEGVTDAELGEPAEPDEAEAPDEADDAYDDADDFEDEGAQAEATGRPREEAGGGDESDDAEAEAEPHPCERPLDADPFGGGEEAGGRRIEVDTARVTLTVPLDARVKSDEPACIWTDDPDHPFYAAQTTACDVDFWGCRRVPLQDLPVGDHQVTVRIGDASPVTFTVARTASDCSLRPPPALAGGGSDEEGYEDEMPSGGAVFQGSSDGFSLTLAEPVTVREDTKACWWFSPPGVAGRVAHQWPIEPCEGEDPAAATCVKIKPTTPLEPGRYDGAVYVGASKAQSGTLWVPPNMTWLWVMAGLGFFIWGAISIFMRGYVLLSKLERWKDHLEGRLESSQDDHQLLLARVCSALAFADASLSGSKLLLVFNDLSPIEQHLLEADQLLSLSERKTRIWGRAEAQLYPPTVMGQILAELKLFDDTVLQKRFPIDEDVEGDDAYPPLTRAEVLLDAAAFNFDEDLKAALALVLAEAPEDEEPPPDLADAEADVEEICATARERELAALRKINAHLVEAAIDEIAPALQLEVDLRLDVLRKLDRLVDTPSTYALLNKAKLRDALEAWNEADLQDSFAHAEHRRIHRDLLRELVWRPANLRFAQRFMELEAAQEAALAEVGDSPEALAQAIALGKIPLTVETITDQPWRTYSPQTLVLTLSHKFADLNETYPWRKLTRVDWYHRKDEATDPFVIVNHPLLQSDDGPRIIQLGPKTVAFARRSDTFTLRPTVSLPEGAESGTSEAEGRAIASAPLVISVGEGTRETQNKRVQIYNRARVAVSLAGSVAAAAAFFDGWRASPPLHVYWQALLVPIGVDVTTLTVPAALGAIRKLLPRKGRAQHEHETHHEEGGGYE